MALTMARTSSIRGAVQLVSLLVVAAGSACATAPEPPGATVARPTTAPPAPARREDGLAMRAERGSIDRDEAEEAIAQHWSRLKGCYAEAGAATTFAGGSVSLHFNVAVDGRATEVAVQSSGLGNLAVERCLVTAGLAVRFPRPHGNGRATVEYSMEFRSTQERKVLDLPDEATIGLRQSALARLGADCGSVAPGTLVTTFYVDRRGQVESAGLAAKTAIPSDSASCVATSLQRAPLPLAAALGLGGDSLGRLSIAFTNADLVAAMSAPPPAVATRSKRADRADRERLAAQSRRRRR
jgi:hypothetical protein